MPKKSEASVVSVTDSWDRPKFGKKHDRKKKTKDILDKARKGSL